MAGSSRFELPSSSPESSSLAPNCANGPWGIYTTLERSGSFIENRTLASSSFRSGCSSSKMPPLSQCLLLETFSMGDKKFTRSGELRRILGISMGITSEEHLFGISRSKPLSPAASEELKRFKASVQETSIRARDRAKSLIESIGKLDKYKHSNFTRKRQRNENSSNGRPIGANSFKIGIQGHPNASDLPTPRMDEKSKSSLPNKRIRTSIAEVRTENRNATIARQHVTPEKDRDMLHTTNGGSIAIDGKLRGLPPEGEGWDKKMKKKRSIGTMSRATDGDRDPKRGMQQRLNSEFRARSDVHGFRSSDGNVGINKTDGAPQITAATCHVLPRNDLDGNSLPNERRERAVALDKDRVIAKGSTKLNSREENQTSSPSPVTKSKGSRAPRSYQGVSANISMNLSRTSPVLDGWEQSQCLSKLQTVCGTNNRKRQMPAESSSPPVTTWVGQRQQKSSRTRRTNLMPPLSSQDESQTLSDGFLTTDSGGRSVPSDANGPLVTRGVTDNTPPFKLKAETTLYSTSSESEESGAGENKARENGIDIGEKEERVLNQVHKMSSSILINKKNKNIMKEEPVDSVRRQGRSGRSSTPRGYTPMREKVENTQPGKPISGARTGPDKIESKSGRPPSKKLSERKASGRPVHAAINGLSEFTGESDDDRAELVAAVISARNFSSDACSSSFWRKMETCFASPSLDDLSYLKQQINAVEELDEGLRYIFDGDHIALEESKYKEPNIDCDEVRGSQNNGMRTKFVSMDASLIDDSPDVDASHRKSETESWLDKIIPLSQRLLSAFILEGEIEELDNNSGGGIGVFAYITKDSPSCTYSHLDNEPKDGDRFESETELEMEHKIKRNYLVDSFSYDGSTASNSIRSTNMRYNLSNGEVWHDDDIIAHSEIGPISESTENHHETSHQTHAFFSTISSPDCLQYQQLSLDDRILLELHSIGLYPEVVPDLEDKNEGDINKGIIELKAELHQQVTKRKKQLYKLDDAIRNKNKMVERDIEKLSMDKLLEMAHKKLTGCRGNNSSVNKSGISKISKQAAAAFVKRTMERYGKFLESGKSCFAEPEYRDTSPVPINNICADYGETHLCKQEPRSIDLDASISAVVERVGPANDKIDRVQVDAHLNARRTSDQIFVEQDLISSRCKKKEVLLDDVDNNVSRAAFGNNITGGPKGKRSERERDPVLMKNPVSRTGRPSLNTSFKGERKNKAKPKQRTAQLSTAGNGLLGRPSETNSISLSEIQSSEATTRTGNKLNEARIHYPNASKDLEEPLDLSNFPGMASIEELGVPDDLGAPGQDLNAWFNFDEDVLQDNDGSMMGLEIPMDDLSDLNMII